MDRDDLEKVVGERVYVTPSIPREKLQNALKSYASGVTPEEVLILVDDTLWGGSREGMLVTEKAIYSKELCDSPKRYSMDELRRIHCEKKSVYINSMKFYTYCIVEPFAIKRVVDFVEKVKTASPAQSSSTYASGSLEDKIMHRLPLNGENLILQFQKSLLPAQKAQSILNFADDFLDKMLSVSVEQENKAFRRDVFKENAENRMITATSYKLLHIALCFPDYINRNKSFDPRFISFLKRSDIISLELISYISFRMQFLLTPHFDHENTCTFIEMFLGECILNYANKKIPFSRDSNTIAGLMSDPREQIRNNEIMKRYSERATKYFYNRNGNLDRTLADGILESICLACHLAISDKTSALELAKDIRETQEICILESLSAYRHMADKNIELTLCEAFKKM